jgi:hypothetical protein
MMGDRRNIPVPGRHFAFVEVVTTAKFHTLLLDGSEMGVEARVRDMVNRGDTALALQTMNTTKVDVRDYAVVNPELYHIAAMGLHWRTAQLLAAGIQPVNIVAMALKAGIPLQDMPLHPPEEFKFAIAEAFPGDQHRQIYHAWRRFPLAMRGTLALGMIFGLALGLLFHWLYG